MDVSHRDRFNLLFGQLFPYDQIRIAVRLQSRSPDKNRQRWLVILDTLETTGKPIYYLLGVDIITGKTDKVTIGMVLCLSRESRITLDGDGGIFFLSDPHSPSGTQ